MAQIFHCTAVRHIHRTSDRRERTASLRHAYRYRHVAVARSERKWLRCSFAGSKMLHDQHPVGNTKHSITNSLRRNKYKLPLGISTQGRCRSQHSRRHRTSDPLSLRVPLRIETFNYRALWTNLVVELTGFQWTWNSTDEHRFAWIQRH